MQGENTTTPTTPSHITIIHHHHPLITSTTTTITSHVGGPSVPWAHRQSIAFYISSQQAHTTSSHTISSTTISSSPPRTSSSSLTHPLTISTDRSTVWPHVKHFIAGSASGVSLVLAGHAFDTVKVRLQANTDGRFKGPLHCLAVTVREEGVCLLPSPPRPSFHLLSIISLSSYHLLTPFCS